MPKRIKTSVFKRPARLSRILIVCALFVLIIGVIVSIRQAMSNSQLVWQAKHSAASLSIVRPSKKALATYQVAPSLPRYIIIPKIDVNARVGSVGLTASGAIGTPSNVYDTDWFNQSSKPGETGAMLIDGHISSWNANGVFYNLHQLQPGDVIEIQRGDGKMFTYKVSEVKIYDKNSVNMKSVLAPIDPSRPGLNLISCYGDVIKGTNEFNKRIVVYSTEQS